MEQVAGSSPAPYRIVKEPSLVVCFFCVFKLETRFDWFSAGKCSQRCFSGRRDTLVFDLEMGSEMEMVKKPSLVAEKTALFRLKQRFEALSRQSESDDRRFYPSERGLERLE